jgi:hypothetical protein
MWDEILWVPVTIICTNGIYNVTYYIQIESTYFAAASNENTGLRSIKPSSPIVLNKVFSSSVYLYSINRYPTEQMQSSITIARFCLDSEITVIIKQFSNEYDSRPITQQKWEDAAISSFNQFTRIFTVNYENCLEINYMTKTALTRRYLIGCDHTKPFFQFSIVMNLPCYNELVDDALVVVMNDT